MTTHAFAREQTISSPFRLATGSGPLTSDLSFLVLLLVRIVVGAGSQGLPCLLIAQFRNFLSRHSLLAGLLWHADSKGFPAYQAVFNHDLSWRRLCRFVLLYSTLYCSVENWNVCKTSSKTANHSLFICSDKLSNLN